MEGEIKTITKEGTTYIVRDYNTGNDEVAQNMIVELYEHCLGLSKKAEKYANLYRALSVSSTLVIIACAVGNIFLSRNNSNSTYVLVLSAVIFAIKSIMSTFSIDSKGTLYADQSRRLRTLAREVNRLHTSTLTGQQLLDKIDSYHVEADDIDFGDDEQSTVVVANTAKSRPMYSRSLESLSLISRSMNRYPNILGEMRKSSVDEEEMSALPVNTSKLVETEKQDV